MNEPPVKPLFPPKPGLTKEEQKKVKAFIKAGRMKVCPPMFSPELTAIGIAQCREWAESLTESMKVKLGINELKHPKRTEKEQREHKRQSERDWHRKRKEKPE
jgi:hypothetical protein